MPMTPAEKQRKYREKLKQNPEKYNQMKLKASERALKNYREKISKYTEKDKEEQRLKWREDRKKAKELQNKQKTEPSMDKKIKIHLNIEKKLRNENKELHSEVNILKKKLQATQKKHYRLKKKYEELNIKYINAEKIIAEANSANIAEVNSANIEEINIFNTPQKVSERFIDEHLPEVDTPRKEIVKKKILELNVLTESLKTVYETTKSIKQKQVLKNIVKTNIVKKYKLKGKMTASLGLKTNMRKYRNKKIKKTLMIQKIKSFYERDDISRATAGKKECKTFKKQKIQKRYLLDSMKNLHKKYVEEVGKISLSTFKRYRPFYVLPPKLDNRDTCACIKHANMKFMCEKLKRVGYLKNDLNSIVRELVCDPKSMKCMYSSCSSCSDKKVKGDNINLLEEISWPVWAVQKHEYVKDDKLKSTNKMTKTEKKGTIQDLINTFSKQMLAFKKHVYNVTRQYQEYKTCISNIQNHEAAIHIDFAENHVCKHHEEVQSMHFGSAKTQITLHTGVLHLKSQKPMSFCSISPCNLHNPEAIWAHLDPVLKYLKSNYPDITIVHFFSDGPTSQYRQKKNFYLFSKNIFEHGFNLSTWSFFEASHGKGAADGVGAAIKRMLDEKVAHGLDIPNADVAFDVLSASDTRIKLFYIPANTINLLDSNTVNNLIPCPNTMRIHQLTTNQKYIIKYRDVSCFCSNKSGMCDCDDPKVHKLIKTSDQLTTTRSDQSKTTRKRKSTNLRMKKQIQKKSRKSMTLDIESDTSVDSNISYVETDDSCTWQEEDEEDVYSENRGIKNRMGMKDVAMKNSNVYDEILFGDINVEKDDEMREETLDTDSETSWEEEIDVTKEKKTQNRNGNNNMEQKEMKSLNECGEVTIERDTKKLKMNKLQIEKLETQEEQFEQKHSLEQENEMEILKPNKNDEMSLEEENEIEVEMLDTGDDGMSLEEQMYVIKGKESDKENRNNNIGQKKMVLGNLNVRDEVTLDRDACELERRDIEIEQLDSEDDMRVQKEMVAIKEDKEIMKIQNRKTQISESKVSILSDETVRFTLDAETGLFKLNKSEADKESMTNHEKTGKYILAKFYTKKAKHTYRYVCRIEEVDHFSEKLVVKGLKSVKGDKKKFKLVEKDISIICNEDVLMYLADADIDSNGCVTFPKEINVKEQP